MLWFWSFHSKSLKPDEFLQGVEIQNNSHGPNEISCDSCNSYFCLLQWGMSSTMDFKNMGEITPLIRFPPYCVCISISITRVPSLCQEHQLGYSKEDRAGVKWEIPKSFVAWCPQSSLESCLRHNKMQLSLQFQCTPIFEVRPCCLEPEGCLTFWYVHTIQLGIFSF